MSTTKLIIPAGSTTNTVQTAFGNTTVASDGTVVVDSRAVSALLDAGFTIYSDDLPVGKAQTAGTHVATAGEATADTLDIVSGLSSIDSVSLLILRAGVNVMADAVVTITDGTITVEDGGATYAITAGDSINWFAYGDV